jgi:hypothetical protein
MSRRKMLYSTEVSGNNVYVTKGSCLLHLGITFLGKRYEGFVQSMKK